MSAGRNIQHGFTYLAFLIFVAFAGAGLAAYGELASHAAQREKEAELLFRGEQIRDAIASYYRKEQRYPESPLGPQADAGVPVKASSLWRDAWYRYIRNRGAVIAGVAFLVLVAYCLLWPLVSPYDPYEVDFSQASEGPSPGHPFGTDQFGRDLFTRTALGGRVSIGIGFAATLVILAIGVTYGSIAGFLGGVTDNVLMRFLDALYGLPYLPFAIIVLAIFGGGSFWTMVIALSIASWFTTARIVRGLS